MTKWRYIESGAGSAQWNMAVDEALLRSFKEGDAPLLRMYSWEMPSLSFGRFSRPEEVLHLERLQSLKMPYVRRMTGGGILVHGNDLSHTLIVSRAWVKEKGIKESYRYLCRFLLNFYHHLGFDADFAQEQKSILAHSDVCLAGMESYDIVIDGKKIGGNAQRYTRNALLQHGSIPLGIDVTSFETLFRHESGFDRTLTLEKINIHMDKELVTQCIKKTFCKTFDTVLYPDSLNRDEYTLALRLFHEKYMKEIWNIQGENNTLQI